MNWSAFLVTFWFFLKSCNFRVVCTFVAIFSMQWNIMIGYFIYISKFAFSQITERFLFKTIKLCDIPRFTLVGGPLQSDVGLVSFKFILLKNSYLISLKTFLFSSEIFLTISKQYFSNNMKISMISFYSNNM